MHKLITNESIYIPQLKIVSLTALSTIIPLSSVLIVVHLTTDLNIEDLTRDPSSVANMPFYIGFFSNIGVLLWCMCAAICLFSWAIFKKINPSQKFTNFFLYAGLLNTLLLVDDFFLLHELVIPKVLSINERTVYTVYAIFFLLFFSKFIKIIKQTEFLIIFVGIIFLGLSVICDTIWENIPTVVEDTLKLMGITTWVTYFVRLCWREIYGILNVSALSN